MWIVRGVFLGVVRDSGCCYLDWTVSPSWEENHRSLTPAMNPSTSFEAKERQLCNSFPLSFLVSVTWEFYQHHFELANLL